VRRAREALDRSKCPSCYDLGCLSLPIPAPRRPPAIQPINRMHCRASYSALNSALTSGASGIRTRLAIEVRRICVASVAVIILHGCGALARAGSVPEMLRSSTRLGIDVLRFTEPVRTRQTRSEQLPAASPAPSPVPLVPRSLIDRLESTHEARNPSAAQTERSSPIPAPQRRFR
jgi:hypothetical protein